MRKSMIALVALAALAVSAQAQTPKPAMGSDQIYWVITFTVDQMDKFKPIVQRLVAATEKEPVLWSTSMPSGTTRKRSISSSAISMHTQRSSTLRRTSDPISRRTSWRCRSPPAS